MTATVPQTLTTTTAAETPIADSLPQPSTGPVPTDPNQGPPSHAPHEEWTPDVAALQGAKGDPAVWAHQFSELVGHTTGQWIDESVFAEWLQLYSGQVAQAAYRAALFQIANTPLETAIAGDPSLALLAYRDQLAQSFRKSAAI